MYQMGLEGLLFNEYNYNFRIGVFNRGKAVDSSIDKRCDLQAAFCCSTHLGFEVKVTTQHLCQSLLLAILRQMLCFGGCCGRRELGRLKQLQNVKQMSALSKTTY